MSKQRPASSDEAPRRIVRIKPFTGPGKTVTFRSGVTVKPILPEEWEFASFLRGALMHAMSMDDIAERLRAAGVLIRPLIEGDKERGYRIGGFSFTRGTMTLPASRAAIVITPSLPDDLPLLVSLCEEHDAATVDLRLERDRISEQLRACEALARVDGPFEAVFDAAGIALVSRMEGMIENGRKREYLVVHAETETASVRLRWQDHQNIMRKVGAATLENIKGEEEPSAGLFP